MDNILKEPHGDTNILNSSCIILEKIDLDKINKWFKTKEILNRLGINPQRFSAVYGKNLDDSFINNITHPSVYYSLTYGRSLDEQIPSLGAIGCYLSHIKLWQNLIKSETYHQKKFIATFRI